MRAYAVALWGTWRSAPETSVQLHAHRIVVDQGEAVGCVATTSRAAHIWIDRLYIAPPVRGVAWGRKF
jgi:hypothetical protein